MILEYADLTNDELLAIVADNPDATPMEVELMLRVERLQDEVQDLLEPVQEQNEHT